MRFPSWFFLDAALSRTPTPGAQGETYRLRVRSWGTLLWIAVLCGLLAGIVRSTSAQTSLNSLRASATLHGAVGSGGNLPFWLTANRHGTVDPTSANAGVRAGLHRPLANSSGLDYAFGSTLLGRASRHGTATIHELYGRLQYWKLRLTVGRKEQSIGRVDTSLSLGSVTRSRNTAPLPRVSVSSDGYLAVPGTRDALSFNGYLAHGRLESDRFVEEAFVHEKYLYARLLPPTFPVNGYAGLVHHAQWGGTHPQAGPQQSSLARWIDVTLANEVLTEHRSEAQSQTFDPNHIAMYDFSLSVDFGGIQGLAYRQFYHEDIASFNFRNVWDGLWGVSLRRDAPTALVNRILWEHLRMTRHNAKFSEGQKRGTDRYYDHSHYHGGWTYQGRTLGTPLIIPASMTPDLGAGLPGIGNSIVVAQHVGIEGHLGAGLSYQALGTYSRNYGARSVCANPACTSFLSQRTDRRDQYSFRFEVRGPLSQQHSLRFRLTAALDTGELYDERVGGSFALTWQGALRQ